MELRFARDFSRIGRGTLHHIASSRAIQRHSFTLSMQPSRYVVS